MAEAERAAGERASLASIVVPVLDGCRFLERSLGALRAAGERIGAHELIVVDDGSIDGSADHARALGARVLATGGRALGPARARNAGADAARGDVVVFVDADVAVHPDALELLLAGLARTDAVAAFGAYDLAPAHRGFASLYATLRHHQAHRRASDDAHTFWAGLGAVRRAAFVAAGGFDAERYPAASIEDIELGRRLRAAGGRIARAPDARGTHLKRWSLAGMIHTDVARRARPWAALMRAHPAAFRDLNVAPRERARAGLALVLLLSCPAAAFGWVPAWTVLVLFAAACAANAAFLATLARGGGPAFALAAIAFHQVCYAYSTAVWAWTAVAPPAPPRAHGEPNAPGSGSR